MSGIKLKLGEKLVMKRCVVVLMSLLIISLTLFSGCYQTTTVTTITPVTRGLNLVNGIIAVPAEGYYDIPFSVDVDTMNGVRVKGTFEVSQGTGVELDRVGNTGIELLIFDDIMFTNWANTNLYVFWDGRLHLAEDGLSFQWYEDAVYADRFHGFGSFAIAPGVVAANIDTRITTSGDYHLVFSNRDSPFISKNVSTEVKLYWIE